MLQSWLILRYIECNLLLINYYSTIQFLQNTYIKKGSLSLLQNWKMTAQLYFIREKLKFVVLFTKTILLNAIHNQIIMFLLYLVFFVLYF